ncbi:MAG: ATP-binding cassette domain-containing protein, partial [Ktedonobacteraceae bacterium]|nr:ATP-binding cassette domain-containing protein [Ktedonobacteraceae bacterium]
MKPQMYRNNQPDDILISVDHVGKKIEQRTGEITILDAITFTVAQGSLFTIKGPSGSGKSTLLNILTGIDYPTSGSVLFAGQEVRQARESHMARWRGKNVGIVFQFFQLLSTLTVMENILLAMELANLVPHKQRYERACECLEMVELAHCAKKLPAELSGGQQQRVA